MLYIYIGRDTPDLTGIVKILQMCKWDTEKLTALLQFVYHVNQGEGILATVVAPLSDALTTKPMFLQDFDLNHTGTSPELLYCLSAASLEIPL